MKTQILFLITLVSLTAVARITDNQANFKILQNKIEITTNAGFHLNIEGPASAQFDDLKAIFKPDPKTEKLFTFTAPEKSKKGKLNFYVCDDKKTACEQHSKEISFEANRNSANIGGARGEPKNKIKKDVINKSDYTLLMFSAPWCPACIRMQTETYNQKNVQRALKKLSQQKINIDLPENSDLSDTYHVRAIPTAILVNNKGEELDRWLDFQPANTFAKQISESVKSSSTMAALEKSALAGDKKSTLQLAAQAYNSMNCDEANKWFNRIDSTKLDEKNKSLALASDVMCAEKKADDLPAAKLELIARLVKAAEQTPSEIDQVRWKTDVVEKSKEMKITTTVDTKVLLQKIDGLLQQPEKLNETFAKSTFGDVGGFEKEEMHLMKARLYEAIDNEKEHKGELTKIEELLSSKKLSVEKPGEMLVALAYLKEVGAKEKIEQAYEKLISKFPKSYVYYDKYSRYLVSQKNFEKALVNINQALVFPEGNEPQLLISKAKILKELKNKTEALTTLDKILSLDTISHKKYKKVLAQAEVLKRELTTDHARD